MGQLDKVKSLLSQILEKEGYELLETSLRHDKDGQTLSIVVDRDTPISLEDIVKVSDIINPLLDEEDPIEGAYVLDISSAGSEKQLKLERLDHYQGEYVNLHLKNPYQGENYLEGDLLEVKENELVIELKTKGRKKKVTLERGNVDKARLAIKF